MFRNPALAPGFVQGGDRLAGVDSTFGAWGAIIAMTAPPVGIIGRTERPGRLDLATEGID